MIRRVTLTACFLAALTIAALPAWGQDESRPVKGLPGPAQGIVPTVSRPTLTSVIAPAQPAALELEEHEPGSRVSPAETRRLKLLAQKPLPTGGKEIHLDSTPTPLAPNTGTNFNGLGQNGWIPYDAAIAVGPNHIVVMTNAQWIVYDRTGAMVRAVTQFGTWWGTTAGTPFDPKCFYDPVGGRFVMLTVSQSTTGGNKALYNISISQTGDPTGAWYNYQFDATKDGTTSTSNWADFPGLGYDDNSIYTTSNQFTFSGGGIFQYVKLRVYSKAQLYSGSAATFTDFVGAALQNSDTSQAFTVQPARTLSSTASEYFLNTNPFSGNTVTLWRIDGAPTSPTLVRQTTYSVGAFTSPPDAVQPGTSSPPVVTNDDRMYDFVWRGGIIEASFGEAFSGLAAVRFLRLNTTNNTVVKDVTYTQPGVYYYYPAVTDDSAGNLYMVFSRSSSTEYASVYHTGMQPADSAIQASALVKAGISINISGRWGDYSSIVNDPADSLAVVSYAGWANTSNRWATWITGATFTGSTPTPTLVSVNPSSGVQGNNVNVTLTGQNTHWVQGTSLINISGSGVTASNVIVASATSMTATFAIGASAATGTRNVTVTTGAEVTTSAPFTVNTSTALPTLTSISPTTGNQGTVTPVTLTGTNFVAPASISIGGTNVSASSIVVVNSTTITANFTIGATATNGDRLVSVTTPGGTSGTVKFRVLGVPVITSISPTSGSPGTIVAVTLLGSQFNSSDVNITPSASCTITNVLITNGATKITFSLNIASTAATGPRSITVSNAAGTSNAVSFTVNGGTSAPTLTSVTPNNGTAGAAVNVTLAGTNFTTTSTVNVSSGDITVSNVSVPTNAQITATFTIAAVPTPGTFNVTVTTGNGSSGTQGFTINGVANLPTLTSIAPNNGTQGNSVPVTLTGTNFISGASIGFSSTGIAANSVVLVNSTTITATFVIAANAPLGAQNVTVTTSAGTSGPQAFTVNPPPPTLTSVSPNNGIQGASVPVTLTGTNFISGASIGFSSTSIAANSVVLVNSTTITATFVIAANAPLGAQNVTVTTSAGTSGPQAFTVNPPPPTLSTISPTTGNQGTVTPVTLTGTNFVAPASINIGGTNVSASSIVVVNSTTITANFTIGATATNGDRLVSVTTPGGTSGTVKFRVLGVPIISSISPISGARGTIVAVTLLGSQFNSSDVNITPSADCTLTNMIITNGATKYTFNLNIASTAATGPRSITVSNAAGTSNAVTFTIN